MMKYVLETVKNDPDHGNIITADVRLLKNQKLRKRFTKDPNYRKPQFLNYSKCKKGIDRKTLH